MKKLITLVFTTLLTAAVSATVQVDPGTGDITQDLGGGIIVDIGNVTDMYSLHQQQGMYINQVKQSVNMSQAMAASVVNAKPVTSGEGIYIGGGFGASGSEIAGSVGFLLDTGDGLNMSATLSHGFTDTIASETAVGFGAQLKF